jgi:hypothetical protein
LAHSKIRGSELERSPAAWELRQAYRLHSIQAALHERNIKLIISLLRENGVEPILVKGWAIARLYPEPGMRPYGDLDLCILPRDYSKAAEVFDSPQAQSCAVDLHVGFDKFYAKDPEGIFARSRQLDLDNIKVRVLSPEDDLRLLCLHCLRHGATRPPWLCDVAVLLESLPDDFDWDRCLGSSRFQAEWITCAVHLAHQLLGAKTNGAPRPKKLPGWLISTVLQEWGQEFQLPNMLIFSLRRPMRFLSHLPEEIAPHWPNPIQATIALGGLPSAPTRLPFQIGYTICRAASLAPQIVKELIPIALRSDVVG